MALGFQVVSDFQNPEMRIVEEKWDRMIGKYLQLEFLGILIPRWGWKAENGFKLK